jgi:hypothetical protein
MFHEYAQIGNNTRTSPQNDVENMNVWVCQHGKPMERKQTSVATVLEEILKSVGDIDIDVIKPSGRATVW